MIRQIYYWPELGDYRHAVEWLMKVNPSSSGTEFYAAVLVQCLQSKSAWDGPIEVRVHGRVVTLPQGS